MDNELTIAAFLYLSEMLEEPSNLSIQFSGGVLVLTQDEGTEKSMCWEYEGETLLEAVIELYQTRTNG